MAKQKQVNQHLQVLVQYEFELAQISKILTQQKESISTFDQKSEEIK